MKSDTYTYDGTVFSNFKTFVPSYFVDHLKYLTKKGNLKKTCFAARDALLEKSEHFKTTNKNSCFDKSPLLDLSKLNKSFPEGLPHDRKQPLNCLSIIKCTSLFISLQKQYYSLYLNIGFDCNCKMPNTCATITI